MNATDLHIGRVVLRGAAPAVEHARTTLPAALARAHWPYDDAIVVVRRVTVGGTPAELPGRAAAAAEHLTRRAADPWSPAADGAEAVRFRDALDYRACLIRDLLAGTAARRWLWRHRAALLARPPADALATLLGEDALALPALLDRVEACAALPPLWRMLAAPGARELLHAVGAATGWGHAIALSLQPGDVRTAGITQESGPAPHHVPKPAASTKPGFNARSTGLPGDLAPTDPRVVLHALLALWTATPAVLSRSDAGGRLHDTARELVGAAPTAKMTRPAMNEARGRGPDASTAGITVPFSEPRGSHLQPAAARDTSAPAPLPSPTPTENTATEHRPSGNAPEPSRTAPTPDSLTPSRVSSVAASPATFPPAADVDFHTRGGGFFFLLNVLNLPILRDWRAALDEPQAGWRELVRLARTLDFSPDAPLAAFLVATCDLETGDDPAPLATLAAGADPAPVRLAALRHYGEAALHAALAERPARVRATRSHLEVHLRLSDAHLDIRRTGLDLDPGWLPWLGRVVAFHYDSGGFAP